MSSELDASQGMKAHIVFDAKLKQGREQAHCSRQLLKALPDTANVAVVECPTFL